MARVRVCAERSRPVVSTVRSALERVLHMDETGGLNEANFSVVWQNLLRGMAKTAQTAHHHTTTVSNDHDTCASWKWSRAKREGRETMTMLAKDDVMLVAARVNCWNAAKILLGATQIAS